MRTLTDRERDCLERYCALLAERLGEALIAIRMVGSAARGDMWPARSPMHSDIDLLVLVRGPVPEPERDALVDETYELFLECGRQLSPQFVASDRLAAPPDDRTRAFAAAVAAGAIDLWPPQGSGAAGAGAAAG